MSITAKDVKALRDATGAGMMDAKRALVDCDGDYQAATQLLREKGLAKAAERGDRDNDEGTIAVATTGNIAAVVQIKTETDFSAKSADVTDLAQVIANDVCANGLDAAQHHTAKIEDLRVKIKENIEVGAVERIEAGATNIVDTYLHCQDGRGVNAVVVEGTNISAEDLHQVALHIAFAKPTFLSVSEVPADQADQERATLLEITKAEGKPPQAWEKIVEGRMRGWYAERVLLEQGLHGDKTTVKDSLKGGSIVRFLQVVVGS